MSKRAIITGITGQGGSYLAELLLEQGYEVVGATRRLSAPNHWRIAHLLDRIEQVGRPTCSIGRNTGSRSAANAPGDS